MERNYKVLYHTKEKVNKQKNEDRILVTEFCFYNKEKIKLLLVADGIGSLARSDEAARRAIYSAASCIYKELQRFFMFLEEKNLFFEGTEYIYRLEEILRKAFCEANRSVFKMSSIGTGAGATLSIVLVFGEYHTIAANLGDSPIYHYDGETMKLVSELQVDTEQNVLTNSLGETKAFDVDKVYVTHLGCLDEQEFILLGSDGAFGKLTKEEILDVVKHSDTVNMLESLFDKAGNYDDQSAIYYEVLGEG